MWMEATDVISETLRIPFYDAYDLDIITYLNTMSYVNHKNNKIEQQYKNNSINKNK